MTDIFQIIDGTKEFHGVKAIKNVNFTLFKGEIHSLLGENGAGKSTLLRSIAGRLPAESGHIACHLPRIYIGHADGLAGAISGRKNLQGWAAINDITVQGDNIEQALAGFDANGFADMPVQLLSRGQRRRLAPGKHKIT